MLKQLDQQVQKLVRRLVTKNSKEKLNNRQRVLATLLMATHKTGFVPRDAFQVPNATSRVRELRGSPWDFRVECVKDEKDPHRTLYRLDPSSVTVSKLEQALKVN